MFAATNAGGEIDVLDTAGYGQLTINKAISIVSDGAIASVLVPPGGFGIGITINAGASDAISLRGLTIEGAGIGGVGIVFNSGQSLTIENSVLRHFLDESIDFRPNASSNLSISNTAVADNGGFGILIDPSGSGAVKAVLSRVEMNNNGINGLHVTGQGSTGTVQITVSDSVIANNSFQGLDVDSFALEAPVTLMLFHSVVTNNRDGIQVVGTTTVLAAQSTVTGNTHAAWNISAGGLLQSYGDNYIDANGPNNVGTLTSLPRQ